MKKSTVIEDAPAAPEMTPDMLSKIKKEDMKQAIVERFKATSKPAVPRAASCKTRSPYWVPSDEEC